MKAFALELENSLCILKGELAKKNYKIAPLETLYIGGGTPSLWGRDGASFLQRFLGENLAGLKEEAELTLEVNPDSFTSTLLAEYVEKVGFTRFSFGIQSLDKTLFPLLDRGHSLADTERALASLKAFKRSFPAILLSFDLMLGLPSKGVYRRNLKEEIDKIFEISPDHLSVYILTVKNNYQHHALLASEEQTREEYLEVSELLKSRGMHHYEVSNYAYKDRESRHNLKYWERSPIAALGASAAGYLPGADIDGFDNSENKSKRGQRGHPYRFKWNSSEKISWEELSFESARMEEVYLSLRCNLKDSMPLFQGVEKKISQVTETWNHHGFLDASAYRRNELRLSSRGFLMLDSLMDELFRENLV